MDNIYNRTAKLNKKVDLVDELNDSIFRLEVTLQNDCDTIPFLRTVRDSLKEENQIERERIDSLQMQL